MKRFLILVFSIGCLFLLSGSPVDATCLAMQGTIASTGNWPAGGKVVIGCYGDTPAVNCGGNSAALEPGETFNFQNCSCLVSQSLWVDSSPPGCNTTVTGNTIGNNGDTIYPDVVVHCPTPTPTPQPPTPTPTPIPPTPTPAPPTPTPPPGGPAATATPAPTSPPGAPTATPTRTPTPTSVPTPTVTPPPYADDMCKCDGIELDKEVIVPGDKLTVTAYARVLAENSNYAIVKEMLFSSGKGNGNSYTMDNADMPIVKPVTLIPNTPGKVRYKSTWEYTVPSVLVPNVRYKIWTQPRCAQRTAYSYSSYASVVKSPNVLSAHTANTTFWGMITNFFSGLFGGQPQSNNGSVTPTSTPVPSASRKTIQLDTIKFGKITETDRCQTIYYEASSTL